MDELRKNQKVLLELRDGTVFSGITLDYTQDRVRILITDKYEFFNKINELDELLAIVQTHLGIKKMKSSVISTPNKNNHIIIENTKTIPVIQKREFVRVVTDFQFNIFNPKKNTKTLGYSINLSAGGIAFYTEKEKFDLEDDVIVAFSSDDFEKEIIANAKIIKVKDNVHIAKFINLKAVDENKIVKYVFKLIAKK